MKINKAVEVLNEYGVKAVESTVVKNGIEKACIRIGENQVSPTIYEDCIDSFELEEELIAFAEKALANIPKFNVAEICTKDYFMRNAFTCVRHQTEDESIVKFPVYGDLEEYIRIAVDTDEDSIGSIILTKAQVEQFDIDIDEIRFVARNHVKASAEIKSMSQVMSEMLGISEEELPVPADEIMYVATTANRQFGASIMLLDELLSKFCKEHGIKSVIIIPSSVHEIILICSESDDSDINSMIEDVNSTQLSENEKLSSHCYHFNC